MPIEVVLPKVDMDMVSGVIGQWKVAEGDRVAEGDVLFEMETDKAMMEVESPGTGTIRDLAAVTGEALAVGTVVAWIDTDDDRADA
jgi:pyruvate dehydrogenase E2 component (dihydrolipoamide acetyltransferase)